MNNVPLDRSIRLRAMWCHLSGLAWICLQALSFSISYFSFSFSSSVIEPETPNNIREALSAVVFTASFFSSFPFVIPLIFWLLNRKMHPFVDRAGKDTINYTFGVFCQFIIFAILAVFILLAVCGVINAGGNLISTVLLLSTIGIAALLLTHIATSIYAAIRASKGEVYNYPFVVNILR